MEFDNQDKKCKHTPDIGRGCAFCGCGDEMCATAVEGCYKLHETQWSEGHPDNIPTDIFEVRFKNTRRSFYQNVNNLDLKRGDIVAVEASPGHDIGIISLTGDMVAKQMRRVGFTPYNGEYKKIYRKAKPYDTERWQEAIALEHETMIASRQIAAEMGLNMKIGDVEYQGDKIKAIFYYIADERVDFRELIKVFAERFHIRIEMKQIGARQEAGRIGGIGACGRELCCASWISSFTSVTTNAARVQELSLNPQKLAGQCSKLKCCLMYEYDTYSDARRIFPRVKELQAMDGDYYFIKNDILAGTMTFSSSKDSLCNLITIPVERVKEIMALNRQGKKVDELIDSSTIEDVENEPTYRSEEDSITRFDNKRKRKRNKKSKDRAERKSAANSPAEEQLTKQSETKATPPAAETQSQRAAEPKRERKERGERGNRHQHNRHEPKHQSGDDTSANSTQQSEAQSGEVAEHGNRHPRNRRQGFRRPKGENHDKSERNDKGERGEKREHHQSEKKPQ